MGLMNDLFPQQCTCPTCGQPMQQPVTETTFAKFWEQIPKGRKNGSKANAEKAWRKLTSQEQKIAFDNVAAFYTLTPEERFGAQGLHVSTFLNGKHFNEEVVIEKKARREAMANHDPLALAAQHIKSGKRFLCTQITATTARALIEANRVTESECRAVGVL